MVCQFVISYFLSLSYHYYRGETRVEDSGAKVPINANENLPRELLSPSTSGLSVSTPPNQQYCTTAKRMQPPLHYAEQSWDEKQNEIFTFRFFKILYVSTLCFSFFYFADLSFSDLSFSFLDPFFPFLLFFTFFVVSGRLWSSCYSFFDRQNLFRVVGPKETQRALLYWSWSSCTWWRVHCFHHVVFLALLLSCFFLHCFCRIAFDSFSVCFCHVLFLTLILLHCFYHAAFLALLLLQWSCCIASVELLFCWSIQYSRFDLWLCDFTLPFIHKSYVLSGFYTGNIFEI